MQSRRYYSPLPVRLSLTILRSSPIRFRGWIDRARLSWRKVHSASIQSLEIADIADDPPIYDLTSYMPAIPAFASRIFRAVQPRIFDRGCISWKEQREIIPRPPICPVRIMIIIFPRRQNITAIDISVGARLIPSDFFLAVRNSVRRIISRARRTAKKYPFLSVPLLPRRSTTRTGLNDRHKR